MGYSSIIDSLNDNRVDEGMMSSISKNTKYNNKDTARMLKAIISGQISKLSSKDVDISLGVIDNRTTLYKNNIKYLVYTVVGTKGGSVKTEVKGYNKDGTFYVAITFYNLHTMGYVGKTLLYECSTEDVFNAFKTKIEYQGGFDSVYDTNKEMYSRGVTYYDSNKDMYCTSKDEAIDMIFSYCADSLKNNLSALKEHINSFDKCLLFFTTSSEGMSTGITLYLYGKSDVVENFSRDIKQSKFYNFVSRSRDGMVMFIFNL